eukprot:1126963-Prorocentrum_minimum.AAC.4
MSSAAELISLGWQKRNNDDDDENDTCDDYFYLARIRCVRQYSYPLESAGTEISVQCTHRTPPYYVADSASPVVKRYLDR